MKNILVVNVNWLGDVVFSTPVFYSLKEAYSEASISCLAVPRVQEVLSHCSAIDECLVYDEDNLHSSFLGKIKLAYQLKMKKFDVVFLLHRSKTRAGLMRLAGIPVRVGYQKNKSGILLTDVISPINEEIKHRRDVYLNVIESYGVVVRNRETKLEPKADSITEITKLLHMHNLRDKNFIVVNTGGNWPLKQWIPERFAVLISKLVNDYGLNVVIPGAEKDKIRVDQIIESSGVKAVNLAGVTTVSTLIALFSKAQIVISADSGPLHLANSVGTSVIGLYGPTRPENTGPCGSGDKVILQQDVGCNKAPCYYLNCPDNVCMKSIQIEDVCNAVEKILH